MQRCDFWAQLRVFLVQIFDMDSAIVDRLNVVR